MTWCLCLIAHLSLGSRGRKAQSADERRTTLCSNRKKTDASMVAPRRYSCLRIMPAEPPLWLSPNACMCVCSASWVEEGEDPSGSGGNWRERDDNCCRSPKKRKVDERKGEYGAGDVQDKENTKVTMSKMPHVSLTSEGKWYSPRILHRRNNSVSKLLRIIRPCV